jgi:hypothetical protein
LIHVTMPQYIYFGTSMEKADLWKLFST